MCVFESANVAVAGVIVGSSPGIDGAIATAMHIAMQQPFAMALPSSADAGTDLQGAPSIIRIEVPAMLCCAVAA